MSTPSPEPLPVIQYASTADPRQSLLLLAGAGTVARAYRNIELNWNVLWELRVMGFEDSPVMVIADWVDEASPVVMLIGCVLSGVRKRFSIARNACLLAAAMTFATWATYTVTNIRKTAEHDLNDIFVAISKIMIGNGLECVCKVALPLVAWYLLRESRPSAKLVA